jgi:hypothetical protein
MRAASATMLFALFLVALSLSLPVKSASAGPPAASVAVGCTPDPVTVGVATSCQVIVTGNAPTGSVSFQQSGSGTFSAAACTLNNGACSVNFTPLAVRGSPQTITASYGGDLNNGMNTGTTMVTVNLAASSIFMSCAPSTVTVGSSTTCTATVNGYMPTGSVTFKQSGGSATTSLTSGASCGVNSNTCQVQVTTSIAGGATFVATYSGDGNNTAPSSQAQTTITVNQATTSTSVSCAPAALVVGQTTTCTAFVTGFYPSGTVNWQSTDKSGIFNVNPCTLVTGSCSVVYTPTASATITASYQGDNNNGGSVGTFSITASVNEMIQIVVANSGPVTPVSLSGCSVTPTTVTANGTPQSFQAASGCSPINITLPPPGGDYRYLSSTGSNTLQIGSCAANSCQTFSATIYYQTENTYNVAPQSPASWSASGSIVVNGTQLGTGGQTVCTISVSTGTGQYSCQGWTDFGTQAVMGVLKVSPTERWATGDYSYIDKTGGAVHNSSYFSQVLQYFQYSLIGSSTAPSAPSLSYASFGAGSNLPLIGTASSVWLDSGSSWTVPGALTGSTSSERWDSTVTSGAATAGQNVSLAYYHQYLVDFAYSVIGGGTAFVPPTISFTQFGAPSQGAQSWVDAGSSYAYTNPLAGSTSVERWFSALPGGGVAGAGTINASYYHQYDFALNFTVSGGGIYSNPRLSYTSLRIPELQQVNATRTDFWVDAGTKWGVTPLLPSSTASEEWVTNEATSGTATAPLAAELLYYHQFLATLRYSVLEGGSPRVPSLNYTSENVSTLSKLNTTASSLWMDAGSSWGVPLTIPGGHGERWLSNVTGSVVVNAPFSLDVQYSHQFYVEVGVSTVAGGQVGTADQWRDQGDVVVLNATASKLWSFAYWQGVTPYSYNGTTRLPSLVVSGPANETAVFFPGLFLSGNGPGSVTYSYGTISGTVPANSNATIYPPPGRNVTLTAVPNTVEIMFSGWTGQLANSHLQSTVAIEAPGQVRGSFGTDYTDIRTFAVASMGVFLAAAYILVIRRGFTPKIGQGPAQP